LCGVLLLPEYGGSGVVKNIIWPNLQEYLKNAVSPEMWRRVGFVREERVASIFGARWRILSTLKMVTTRSSQT
jgi:hypothetical protein